jgi:hypothetical protein
MTFSPELAPEEMLLEQALVIEKMPAEARQPLESRLLEEKVVLLRKIISDQIAYISVAKEWFTAADLVQIRRRKIGPGKIGGKAAGLLLAGSIIEQAGGDLRYSVHTPESYYLGSDLIYTYMSVNRLTHWNEQKYKDADQIRAEYPRICSDFEAGEFTPDITEKLQEMLDEMGSKPVIVRSSSQLEDSFNTSFAGKYNSFFCPNQGSPQENLVDLTKAIARTFASTLRPDALLYRRSKGLQDYDERMAVMIQAVQGETFGQFFLPFAAGVAFSRNLYRWSPEIRREDGFVRLVWGLGTRAVERVGNDYPRLVALSHPNLQPDDSAEAMRRYSQQYVDVIDLKENRFKTLPIYDVLAPDYACLRYLVLMEQENYFSPLRTRVSWADLNRLVITFSECLRRSNFASTMSAVLRLLEEHYHSAIDLEFTLSIPEPQALQPQVEITLLQCRPQSHIKPVQVMRIPENLPEDRQIFSTQFMVPLGYVSDIRYVIFVAPESYYRMVSASERCELGRLISRLNTLLPPKSFICVGPGRWGTTNPDLGVFVAYSDIFNAAALVELSGQGVGEGPEPSLGTHFFQDLMEAEIYPLALLLGSPGTKFNRQFFYNTPNMLGEYINGMYQPGECLKLIDVESFQPGMRLQLIMDDEQGQALAFLSQPGAKQTAK